MQQITKPNYLMITKQVYASASYVALSLIGFVKSLQKTQTLRLFFLSLQPPQVHNTHPRPTSLIHATPLHTDYYSLLNGCCVVNDSINILETNLYIFK